VRVAASCYEWHFVTDNNADCKCKQAQTIDVFLQLIADGVTECAQIAQEMKLNPSTVSKLAKQAIDVGDIKKDSADLSIKSNRKRLPSTVRKLV
jgi:hypothetical protein